MTYDVEINGRTRRIDVERGSGGFTVIIDGRRQVVDVTVIDGVWSLILGSGRDGGLRRSYEVAIVERRPGSGSLTVHVDGRLLAASVGGVRSRPHGRMQDPVPSAAGDGAPQHVMAPMPGKVIKVLVRPGDAVAARQGVLVVEAMKMENELRAPKAGRVAEIRVTEGVSVEAGAILAIIE